MVQLPQHSHRVSSGVETCSGSNRHRQRLKVTRSRAPDLKQAWRAARPGRSSGRRRVCRGDDSTRLPQPSRPRGDRQARLGVLVRDEVVRELVRSLCQSFPAKAVEILVRGRALVHERVRVVRAARDAPIGEEPHRFSRAGPQTKENKDYINYIN